MTSTSWETHADGQEQAETGKALTDLTDDLEWLAGEFPGLADQAQALRTSILALPGWHRDETPAGTPWPAGGTFTSADIAACRTSPRGECSCEFTPIGPGRYVRQATDPHCPVHAA